MNTKTLIILIGEIIGIALISASLFSLEFPIHIGIGYMILFNFGYLLGSLKTVGPDELALETFFGKPTATYQAGAGLVLAPVGFFKLIKLPSITMQFQFPGEPEQVFKDDDKDELPEGMLRPMRITTGQEEKIDPNDPMTRRLTCNVSGIIRWRISDPLRFIKNVGTIEHAEQQLRDTGEKALVEIFGTKSPKKIIEGIKDISKTLVDVLQQLVTKGDKNDPDGWGAEIEDFQTLTPDFGHSLNTEMSKAVGATYLKIAEIEKGRGDAEVKKMNGEAEAYAKSAIGAAEAEVQQKKGEAEAKVKALLFEAQAKGYAQIAKELGIKETEVILQIEAVKEALAKAGENGHIFFNMPNISSLGELFKSINNKT